MRMYGKISNYLIPALVVVCAFFVLAESLPAAPPPPHIHSKFAYVTWSKDKGYEIKIFAVGYADPDPSNLDWVAKARYQSLANKTGWGFLEVETKPSWPDNMQAFAAGFAEGYLTRDLIYYYWKNMVETYCDDKVVLCKYINKYISQNTAWMRKNIEQSKNSSSYWYQLDLVVGQGDGIYEGFKRAANGTSMTIPANDFVLMNIFGDLSDLESALNPNPKRKLQMRDGHCSALIKLIGTKDIYASHVTWNSYQSMIRLIKKYYFPYKTSAAKGSPRVPGESISMSSYPGIVFSMDDFYLTSSGLMVQETTLENYNNDLWGNISSTNSVFTGLRTMIANRLANDGRQWTKLFSRYNSGTYNNQWMVLDYDVFEPGRPINDGLLWVLEQLPGMIVSQDVTPVLRKQGYWASYNSPYFKQVYEASGYPKMAQKYGDFFTYESTPRAKIFARDQGNVEDIDSMMQLMRYNDYTHDELSKCDCQPPYSAVNAISSRCDLNPANGTYPFYLLGHRKSGATDMKLTNLDLFLLQQFVAIGGPTYNDNIPPFQWSKADFKDAHHYGMPDKYEYEPIIHHWKWV